MRSCLVLVALAGCGRVGFDGAPPGDASGDAGDGPSPACPHVFCDGFEDPLFGAWTGANYDPPGTAAHDATFGHRGASLKAVGPSGSSEADRFADVFPAAQVPHQWVRLMLYAPSGQTLDLEALVMMDPTRSQELVFSLYEGDIDIHAHGIAGDVNVTRPVSPARDVWTCYELHVEIGTSGVFELFVDGAALAQTPMAVVPRPGTALSRIAVGIVSKPDSLAETVWIDDVVADTSRIGCP